jgi:sugar transferase EpsL
MYSLVKRSMDVCICLAVLPIAVPLALAVAVLIAGRLGRPIFFCQTRVGLGERLFLLRKFRSMRPADDLDAGPDEARLTRLGRLLRSTSLDEIPTLWNVIRGDMSIVGPRPLLPEYLPLYHEVKPGVTGWAQVRGRNAISWEERLALDVWYVDHRSIGLDMRIIASTIGTVLSQRGVAAEGHATMPRFTGSGGGA